MSPRGAVPPAFAYLGRMSGSDPDHPDSTGVPPEDVPGGGTTPAPEEAASSTPLRSPGESVLDVIGRRAGIQPRVLLRDLPQDEAPILRVHGQGSDEAAKDDSRYQVVGEIGRGGVGIIFKSRDRDLGRDVAMKVLRQEMAEKPHVVERFIEEAQVAGQLQHPGIVPVYGMGLQKDGRPYFTMKLVKGRTLSAMLTARRTPREQRRRYLGIFEQLCQTVAYAHSRGVVHRDLKPANVMVGAFGEVQLMDWGFAKVLGRRVEEPAGEPTDSVFEAVDTVRSGSEGSQSIAGSVMGTPAYMPPEQAMGRIDALDERADVFALGSILCEIICGKPAYVGESTEQLVQAARGKVDDAFERLGSCQAPDALKELAKACLAPAPDARPRDAGRVAEEIGGFLAAAAARAREAELKAHQAKTEAEAQQRALLEERAKTEREEVRDQQRRREAEFAARGRRRALVLAMLVVLAVLVGGGAWFGIQRGREDRERETIPRVHAALRNASQLRARGRWEAALDEIATARELAAEHIDDRDLADRIEQDSAAIVVARAEAEQAEKVATRDDQMARALTEVSAWVSRQTDFAPAGDDPFRVEALYDNAFRGYGIDADRDEINDSVRKIKSSRISDELASALDDWVWVRRVGCKMEAPRWERLLEIAMASDDDPLRKQLREAIHSSQGDKLRTAVKALDVTSLDPRTLAMIGRALIQANDRPSARQILEQAHRQYPEHVGVNHYLAIALMPGAGARTLPKDITANDLALALRCRSAIVALRPDEDESWMQLGNTLLWLGRWEEGRAAFWRATELEDGSVVNHIGLGMSHGLSGTESGTVERDYERDCRSRSVAQDTPAFLAGLGLGHLQFRRLDRAIPYLERALAAGGEDYGWVVRMLAAAYFGAGRYEEALRSAREGLQHKSAPMGGSTGIVVRHLAFAERKSAEAVALLDAEIGPFGRGPLHDLRMRILSRANNHARMIALLEPRVSAGNEPPISRVVLGSYRAFAGDAQGAHADWEAVLKAHPEDATLLMRVAWLYATHRTEAARQPQRALELARRAVELDPESWLAKTALAAALRASGFLDQAKSVVRTYLMTRASAQLWRDGARLWATLGEHELASAAYQEAVRLFPADALTLNAAAWSGVMGPDGKPSVPLDKAREFAKKAITLSGKNWGLRNTLAHLLLRSAANATDEERRQYLEEAIIETRMSTSIRGGRMHPADGFVQAMALWQLDRKPEAQAMLAKAMLALVALDPRDEADTLRTRDEAIAMIGEP